MCFVISWFADLQEGSVSGKSKVFKQSSEMGSSQR